MVQLQGCPVAPDTEELAGASRSVMRGAQFRDHFGSVGLVRLLVLIETGVERPLPPQKFTGAAIRTYLATSRIALFVLFAVLTGCCGKFFRDQHDLVALSVVPANTTVTPGSTQQFTATGTFYQYNGSTGDVTAQTKWTSSNPAVATIDANGLATAVAYGSTTIKGNCDCYNSGVTLTVGSQAVSLISIAVTPATLTTIRRLNTAESTRQG